MLTVQHCRYLNKNKCNYSIVNLRNHLIATSKFPKHLAILLGQEEISITDVVRLISWCTIAEIPYVSFYDHKGILQKNETLIRKKFDELEPLLARNIEWSNLPSNEVSNSQSVSDLSHSKSDSVCTRVINDDATDIFNKYKTRIKIFSYIDGKEKIVSLTKTLAKYIDLNMLQEKDITSELLNKELNLYVKMPDPDIAIVFGKILCTYGFMPWQTRVTEFFVIPTHHGISSVNFIETLIKFSECRQRYGK
ncbi:PREDICTED: dehydrodolichyl diphosphate syntase complex subunit nus1 [Ceratosolen solmsi marchali]|uniref:ditrans,polycis-polyprenyl diphosphate synthase [(2E,6E)-farnesyldiphosphate specific] n=1 Tax=Ceratosolen solmsi marchali TaxID=326594 RepID=A0AAJ7DVP9_9HYME|nr:PREDICTED: dehydrodolichyl diphosphate syntase complex subunit nus1 [Ceratosolen solmsi marchali]